MRSSRSDDRQTHEAVIELAKYDISLTQTSC